MAAASLALAVSVDVHVSNEAGVRMELPDAFGDWRGSEIKFCQKRGCEGTYLVADLADPAVCPACGGPLHSMTRLEAEMLPDDTGMLKKRYTNGAGRTVHATVVLSGKERGSIHRPEVCLTGQGSTMVGKQVIAVPLPGRDPLQVMVLDLEHKARGPGGRETVYGTYYAYWFIGKGRETPHHYMRMFLMAADRVLHNVAHRWAYISLGGARALGTDGHLDEIRDLVAALYPHMAIEAPGNPP